MSYNNINITAYRIMPLCFSAIKCNFFIHHLTLDSDFCITGNVGRTEINLVTSNNLYFFSLVYLSLHIFLSNPIFSASFVNVPETICGEVFETF